MRSEKEEEERRDSVYKSNSPTLTRWGADRKTDKWNYMKVIKSACFGDANIHSPTNISTT